MFKAAVKVATLGMVNFTGQGVILKDPITGLGNMLAEIRDSALHDLDQGVWIGKRTGSLIPLGISSYALSGLNRNLLHYAIRVDGITWHTRRPHLRYLVVPGMPCARGSLSVNTYTHDKITDEDFQWFYVGKALRAIQPAVDLINHAHLQFVNSEVVIRALKAWTTTLDQIDVVGFLTGEAARVELEQELQFEVLDVQLQQV